MNSNLYLKLVRGGAARLAENRQAINDLNVFPIPDGDTGDNMFMTIEDGAHAEGESIGEISKSVAQGMLLGARGNSGVILSRIFAGIAKGLDGVKEATLQQLEKAFSIAVNEAYGAVPQPVEGTILTVLREGVEATSGAKSIDDFFDKLVDGMDKSLQSTPEKLEVLKKAGVIDSGGAGLLCIAEGMRDALHGDVVFEEGSATEKKQTVDFNAFTEDSVLEFGYCTEFLLRLQRSKVDLDSFDENVIKNWLASVGDSLVFFRDGSIIKVHVHTKTPGDILSHCQQWGEFLTIKVENMTLQHHENHMDERFKQNRKAIGVLSVAAGEGLMKTFLDMGADEVIEGGQTMNPPVEKFIEAFDRIEAETIIVLPNNSNILMTARQAAELYDKARIEVIPTKTLGEGYYALANLDTSFSVDELVPTLESCISETSTGLVSQAIRDSEAGKKGEWIGIHDKDILCSCTDRSEALLCLAEKMGAANHDVAVLFTGAEIGGDEAEKMVETLQNSFKRTEIFNFEGGQPVYDYILLLC